MRQKNLQVERNQEARYDNLLSAFLIVTKDLGPKAVENVKFANEQGSEFRQACEHILSFVHFDSEDYYELKKGLSYMPFYNEGVRKMFLETADYWKDVEVDKGVEASSPTFKRDLERALKNSTRA
ncbi:MAG: hypothetical protein ACREBF_00965 [Candidatus Micrarchaeales archaeon]